MIEATAWKMYGDRSGCFIHNKAAFTARQTKLSCYEKIITMGLMLIVIEFKSDYQDHCKIIFHMAGKLMAWLTYIESLAVIFSY